MALAVATGTGIRAEPPRRVVSLNPCLDAIVLAVADPAQITALSRYSQDPNESAVAAGASRFAFTRGSDEEIVALAPDLLLIGGGADAQLARVLPRLHVRAAAFGVPETVAASEAQVTRVASLLGHPDRGALVNRRIEAALAAAAPRPGARRFGALVYAYHGVASGPGTLIDALMRRAGFDNLAARYGLRRTQAVSLERLIADPPAVLLAGSPEPGAPSWADRVLAHPALAAITAHTLRESLPQTLLFCGGPVIIPTMAALTRARVNAAQGLSR